MTTLAPRSPCPRVGFLGLGWIGFQRMVSVQEAGLVEIAAVADSSAECLERALAQAPGATPAADLSALLALGLDGVVIATPSAQHAAESLATLQHGAAVFCQKPLGRNLTEAAAVVTAARQADRLLGVDLSYRHTAALQALRPLLQSGELGEIYHTELTFHNAYGPGKPWFFDPVLAGGGCVMDLGIHLVDAALWLLRTPVRRVRSRLFHQGRPLPARPTVCEDFATAQLDLTSGATVHLTCSWHAHAGRDAVIEARFYGTRGGAALLNVHGSFTDFTAERFHGTQRTSLTAGPDAWGGRAAVTWTQQLATRPAYDPAIEHLLEVTAALDAIYASAE